MTRPPNKTEPATETVTPASEQRPSSWKKGCTSVTPIEDRSGHPLSGCCFMVRGDQGESIRQGVIRAVIPSGSPKGDLAVVQYFEAFMGERNTLALVPLSEMERERESSGNSWGGWVLFEDNKQLQEYFEMWQSARDERYATRQEKKATI